MKKIISIVFATSFLITGTASAQTSMMTSGQAATPSSQSSPATEAALQEIYKSQNVSGQNQVNCSKVSDDQFGKLGDAAMGLGITEQQHKDMETTMGGEGSTTLTQAHINMGRAYIGCYSNYNANPSMMGMIGMGMMGNSAINSNYSTNNNMQNSMMGGSYMMDGYHGAFVWCGWITIILVWAFLILSIIALLKWLSKNK